MRLCIVEILHTVLQITEKRIGLQQASAHLRRQQFFFCEYAQGGTGRAVAKPWVAATPDQLKNLRKEFNFAYAAAAKLDIDIALRMASFLSYDFGPYLRMHITQRMNRAKIQVATVNERSHNRLERSNVLGAPGQCTRFDPGITFPLAPLHHQILLKHPEAGCQWA